MYIVLNPGTTKSAYKFGVLQKIEPYLKREQQLYNVEPYMDLNPNLISGTAIGFNSQVATYRGPL